MDDIPHLEYEDQDLLDIGGAFREFLDTTDPELDIVRRYGIACLSVVSDVLETLLDGIRKDNHAEDDDSSEDPTALYMQDVRRRGVP